MRICTAGKHSATLLLLPFLLVVKPVSGQGLPDVVAPVNRAVDRQVERMQERSSQQAQQQVESAQIRATERTQGNTLEQVQQRAGTVQQATTERVQQRVEIAQQQAADRAQNRAGEIPQAVLGRVQEQSQANGIRATRDAPPGRSTAINPPASVVSRRSEERGPPSFLSRLWAQIVPSSSRVTERAVTGSPASLPERLPISDRNSGRQAFVEIAITPHIRVIEHEWVMIVSANEREGLSDSAPALMQFLSNSEPFRAAGGYLLTFSVPPDLDAEDAILELVPSELREQIDRNHVYSAQSASSADTGTELDSPQLSVPTPSICTDQLGIGIIDSRLDTSHPAFASASARQALIIHDVMPDSLEQPHAHGTAVAGLLVGAGPDHQPLLPAATLFSASVLYAQDQYHQGATATQLLKALDWLMEQEVSVINMSLTGPPNRLLEATLRAVREQGKVVVAAAGNAGPHAPPLYPAAYPGVLAVSAVDQHRQIYRWANQGEHIDFTAIGVSVPTARADGNFGRESGTSLATPVISAFLACALARENGDLTAALDSLTKAAIDLGEPGRDPVYGVGLLHPKTPP